MSVVTGDLTIFVGNMTVRIFPARFGIASPRARVSMAKGYPKLERKTLR